MLTEPFWVGKLFQCSECQQFGVIPPEAHKLAQAPHFTATTDRLNIRLAHKKNWQAIHAIHSDPLNYSFEITGPSDERKVKKDLKEANFPRGFRKSKVLLFVAENTQHQEILGTFRLQFTQPFQSATIGFMFAQQHQGKGFASESLSALSQLLLDTLGLEKLSAICDSKNLACQAVLERAGFEREGFLRKFFYHPERGWLDSPTYARFPKHPSQPPQEADPTAP